MNTNKFEELEAMVNSMKNEINEMTNDDSLSSYPQSELEFEIEREAKLAMLEWFMIIINETKEK